MADREGASAARPKTPLPRDFSLLWIGSAASQLGSMNAAIALPLLALSLTHSPVFAGWVAAAGTFPSLLLHLPAGVLVDRFDRRRIMLLCQGTRFVIALVLAIGLITMVDPTSLLIGAAAADGTLASLCNFAEAGVVRQIVPAEALPDAMARNEARSHIALLLGRPLGGFLYGLHRSLPFAVDAISSFVSMLLVWSIKTRNSKASDTPDAERQENLLACVRYVLSTPFLCMVMVVCTLTNFGFQTIFLMLIVQAESAFESTSVIGILFAASGLGGTLGAIAAPRLVRRGRQLQAIFVCVWLWVLVISLMCLFDRPLTGLVGWGAISFIGAHVNVALTVYQARWVPNSMLARVTSINSFVTRTAVPLGALFSGYLLSMVADSRQAGLVVLALTGAVAIGVTVWGGKRRKMRPADLVRWTRSRLRPVSDPQQCRSNAYHSPTDVGANAVRHPRG